MVSLCFFQFQMSQLNIIDSEVFLIFSPGEGGQAEGQGR